MHQGVVQYDSLRCMTVITLSLLQYLANTPFVVAATTPLQVCIHFLAGLCKLMNVIVGRFVYTCSHSLVHVRACVQVWVCMFVHLHVRHKCKAERANPVAEQKGACQCGECGRWLKSRGGLARHKCTYPQSAVVAPLPASPLCCVAHCQACDRCFASTRGRARHRCSRTCSRPTVQDRQGFTCVCACSRRFRLPHHLDRHRAVCSSSLSAAPPGPT